ncbi:MAG TPA: hypothetical protein VIH95_10675 [Acidimicrobiales bacterium]
MQDIDTAVLVKLHCFHTCSLPTIIEKPARPYPGRSHSPEIGDGAALENIPPGGCAGL